MQHQVSSVDTGVASAASATADPSAPCSLCGSSMLPRRGRWGLFWGCAAFETSGCKFTRRAAPSAAAGGYAVLEMDTPQTFRLHVARPPASATNDSPSAQRGSDVAAARHGDVASDAPLRRLIAAAGLAPQRVDRRADGVVGAVFPLDAHAAVRRRIAAAAPRMLLLPVPVPTLRFFQRRRPSPTGGAGGAGGGARWWLRLLPDDIRRSLLPFQARARISPCACVRLCALVCGWPWVLVRGGAWGCVGGWAVGACMR